MNRGRDLAIIESAQQLRDALNVSVMIDFREVLKITVDDLIKKRNSPSNKDRDSFDVVLLYYLGDEDFKKYVTDKQPIKTIL